MSRSQPIDVRDMAIVHRTFRSAYAESARLVRAQPTPSAGRVPFVADHIDFGLEMLHHHHASHSRRRLLVSHVDDGDIGLMSSNAMTWDGRAASSIRSLVSTR